MSVVMILLFLLLFGGLAVAHFNYIRDTEKTGPLATLIVMLCIYIFGAGMLFLIVGLAGGVDRMFFPR